MGSHMIQSKLFCDQFSTQEMREIFSDENMIQKWIDVEVALALAESELGLIPEEAAQEIRRKGDVKLFEIGNIKKGIDHTWHPIVPFIREYKRLCDGEWGEYIHWGATTQDIMDTGAILQIREALAVIERDLKRIERTLCELAGKYKSAVMAGRTHGQHALPITFGYKVAVWAAEIHRHLKRLEELKQRVLVGNVAGAVGTLAAFGEIGWEVQRRLLQHLKLEVPEIAWHVSRDRIADITFFLGMIGGTFGKIANEIIQLQKTEIAELEEPFQFGKVGSSTMPQKRNPMICEAVCAICQLLRTQSSLGLEVMVQEHERDMGLWQAEWEFIPEMFQLAGAVLKHMDWVLKNLQVRTENMERNLNITNGLILAEAVMMQLAKKIGRQQAHDVVYEISMDAFEHDAPFAEKLKKNPKVSQILASDDIDRILDPKSYVGLSEQFVENVIRVINDGK